MFLVHTVLSIPEAGSDNPDRLSGISDVFSAKVLLVSALAFLLKRFSCSAVIPCPCRNKESQNHSKQINVDASQIAKDLSYVNISGRTRVGYEIDALIEVLERFLGFTKMHKAFLFGVGSLGGALLRDSGLHHFGLEIVGAFDINPGLVGKEINGIPIYHSDEFEIKMKSCDVNIGVLTVPINIAQEITDKMIAGGIKAVWNFTPFRIRVPENIVVQNTSLYAHLAVMFNRLNVIQE